MRRFSIDEDHDAILPIRVANTPSVAQFLGKQQGFSIGAGIDGDDCDLVAIPFDQGSDGLFDGGVVVDDGRIVREPAATCHPFIDTAVDRTFGLGKCGRYD